MVEKKETISNMADEIAAARARMIEKRFGGNANGASMGDGAARRKKKGPLKSVGGLIFSVVVYFKI